MGAERDSGRQLHCLVHATATLKPVPAPCRHTTHPITGHEPPPPPQPPKPKLNTPPPKTPPLCRLAGQDREAGRLSAGFTAWCIYNRIEIDVDPVFSSYALLAMEGAMKRSELHDFLLVGGCCLLALKGGGGCC